MNILSFHDYARRAREVTLRDYKSTFLSFFFFLENEKRERDCFEYTYINIYYIFNLDLTIHLI